MAKITRLTDPPPEGKRFPIRPIHGVLAVGLGVMVHLCSTMSSRLNYQGSIVGKPAEPTREEIWAERNAYRACLIYHEDKGLVKAGLSCTHMKPEGADPQKVWEVRHTDRENKIGYRD